MRFTKKSKRKTLLTQGFSFLFEVDQLIFTNEVARTLVGRATFVNQDYVYRNGLTKVISTFRIFIYVN